jgi:hypothetical protein
LVVISGDRITVKGDLGHLLDRSLLLCSGKGLPTSNLIGHPALIPFSV